MPTGCDITTDRERSAGDTALGSLVSTSRTGTGRSTNTGSSCAGGTGLRIASTCIELPINPIALQELPCLTKAVTVFAATLQREICLRSLVDKTPTSGGHCWRTLFTESVTGWDDVMWLPVGLIKSLAKVFRLDTCHRFTVWYSPLGLTHLEAAINGAWSAQDIVSSFPNWFLVGGTFMEDGLREGYTSSFLNRYAYYSRDTRISRGSRQFTESPGSSTWSSTHSSTRNSSSPDEANGTSTGRNSIALMNIISGSRPDNVYSRLVGYFSDSNNIVELSRLDMEIIARVLGGFCYAACSASSRQFQNDVAYGPQRGDTLDSFIRVLENDKLKGKSVPNAIPKTFHVDLGHISRYPFDGSVQIDTAVIEHVYKRMVRLKVLMAQGSDQEAIQEAAEGVVVLASRGKDAGKGKYMALAYDIALTLGIDLSVFGGRVYRILDIQRWNTRQDAEAAERRERRHMLAIIARKRSKGIIVTPEESAFMIYEMS